LGKIYFYIILFKNRTEWNGYGDREGGREGGRERDE
jgi:hypothetical protein